ncbi:MAG: acyl-CoA thioesterase [Bdellovibrionota bacterium]
MPKTYRCTLEVRGYELDAYGHVNHATYISYLEQARWKMLQEEGIDLNTFEKWQRWPVIANLEVSYLKPAYASDLLEVETSVSEHTRASFTFAQTIRRGGLEIFRGRVRAVMINENGRPTELPEELHHLWQ